MIRGLVRKVVNIIKAAIHLSIRVICRVVLLKCILRWFVRKSLHSKNNPGWLDRIMASLSSVIPIDDIDNFEDAGMGINVVTKPDDHHVVATTYWRGFNYIDAETVAVFCERARFANTILDIGANWGYYSLLAGSVAPNARIVAFEPHPFWFQQLKRNVTANRFENIQVENLALSDQCGNSSFYLGSSPGTSSLVKEYQDKYDPTEININTITLDKYMRDNSQNGNKMIDLIKLDVEFHESAVLAGAKSIIKQCNPDIICEVIPDSDGTYNYEYRTANREDIMDILGKLGYSFYWFSDCGLKKENILKGHYPLSNYLFTTRLDP